MFPITLSEEFISRHANHPKFAWNGLGSTVYKRTYARTKPDGTRETWRDTVKRVVEGAYWMKKDHFDREGIEWDQEQETTRAERMFERILSFKFMPPGRGLWAMGTDIVMKKRLFAALNNCAFVSMRKLADDPTKPFCFLMDMSMLGVGTGFDAPKTTPVKVKRPTEEGAYVLMVQDSREGWVEALKCKLESWFDGSGIVDFDYSLIRPRGSVLNTFGGVASGPEPLRKMLADVDDALEACLQRGGTLDSRAITDVMNHIGVCVVSGNVRRTAEIAFGEHDDLDFITLKNDPARISFGWTSNNTIYAHIGMDYDAEVAPGVSLAMQSATTGEPGYMFLDTARAYGRMCEPPNWRDHRACGANPCMEQTLESYELCCLVETFPHRAESLEDYLETCDVAFEYAKIVTTGQVHWPESWKVIRRNRRIGQSMSGVVQLQARIGEAGLIAWCDAAYDRIVKMDAWLSPTFRIPRSIKVTSIKPSGTVSLLAGATPGVHFPISRFYKRRVRLDKDSPLVQELLRKGILVEPMDAQSDPNQTTWVATFIVDAGEGVRSIEEVSLDEQIGVAAICQEHYADNQVSGTFTVYNPAEVSPALRKYESVMKGMSFLPAATGWYKYMPYEKLTPEEHDAEMEAIARRKEENATMRKSSSSMLTRSVCSTPDQEELGELMFCDGPACGGK